MTWTSGAYYNDRRRIGRTNPNAANPAVVREHWGRGAQLLGITW